MHWVHLVSLLVLVWTGFFIRKPFYNGSMVLNQMLHYLFMWVFVLTAVVRVYWAFFGGGSAAPGSTRKIKDYRWFWMEKANKGTTLELFRYYLFLRPTHPRVSKYNAAQKVSFFFWLLLMALVTLTGLCLWAPTQSTFLSLTYLLGGLAAVRSIHYLIMWLFISTVMVHIYLVFVEVLPEVPLMLWWKTVSGSPKTGRKNS